MKKIIIIVLVLVGINCFSQSLQDYKAVLIPLKFDFQKEQNQFRLQTLSKFNLEKVGLKAYYNNENIPSEIKDRCQLLTLDLVKESTFLVTKIKLLFRDCHGVEIYKSEVGKSREKEFELGYKEALENAFKTLKIDANVNPIQISESNKPEKNGDNLLYAQVTSYGFQLIDSLPKLVMKVYKTSNSSVFIAEKEDVQGVLIAKENQWFFEYYQNEKLVSEVVNVKF